ncbi:MAG: hypothetical protein LBR19_03715 [Bifidobacteriaceae bacterium]|jgi:hypothetical protein|nr:hypothetical protein [Bifidobacteriaceae bacterium]
MRARPGVASLIAVACAAALAAGTVIGYVWSVRQRPAELQAAGEPVSAPVTQASTDDARTVTLTVELGESSVLRSPGPGRVTAAACQPGVEATSGTSLFSIDGSPLLNLATSEPLWRSLYNKNSGGDVTALAAALSGLGYFDHPEPTAVDRPLIDAFTAALDGIGVTLTTDQKTWIDASRVLWLPGDGFTVAECQVEVGQDVATGDVLAVSAKPLTAVRLAQTPSDLIPGERSLVLGDLTLPIDEDGQVTDPAALEAIAASPEFALALAGGFESPFQAKLALSQPVRIAAVPAAALVIGAADGDQTGGDQASSNRTTACVLGDGEARRVTIVGSQLGQTQVMFDGAPPGEVSLQPDQDLRCG